MCFSVGYLVILDLLEICLYPIHDPLAPLMNMATPDRARRDARRVFARHTRAAIAPTRTDALAHYSTTRRTERTARARRRRDPGAVSVDG